LEPSSIITVPVPLPLAVAGGDSVAERRTDGGVGQLPHQHPLVVGAADDDVGDVLQAAEAAVAPDQHGFTLPLDVAGAHRARGLLDGPGELAERTEGWRRAVLVTI
jgi:hypothetical protein